MLNILERKSCIPHKHIINYKDVYRDVHSTHHPALLAHHLSVVFRTDSGEGRIDLLSNCTTHARWTFLKCQVKWVADQ